MFFKILTNVFDHLYEELSKKKIELSQHISIELSDLIKKEAFTDRIENILTDDVAKKLISDCLDNGFKFKDEPAKFTPADAVKYHRDMVEYIRLIIEGKFDQKFVVVGHHSPSRLSTHEQYKNETLMNGGYSSELDEFILDHPQIKLWTHGHTHHDFDYMIGSTRVVCNPRGYINYETQADNFTLKYVEI